VTEISHMEPPVHALPQVPVRVKSVSNEGHFTFEAETVFRLHLPSHCSEVTKIGHMVLPELPLRAVKVRLKSVDKKCILMLERK
jgi:hypothetical protein